MIATLHSLRLSVPFAFALLMGAAAFAQKPQPEKVGVHGDPRKLVIEGAAGVPVADIRKALYSSGAYVLSSHPTADMAEYISKVRRCLELGYEHSGFPFAKISVSWDGEQGAVVASIEEGARLKCGKIQIKGANLVPAEDLRQALLVEEEREDRFPNNSILVDREISKSKTLPLPKCKEVIDKVFPNMELAEEGGDMEFLEPAAADETKLPGVWEPGGWLFCQPGEKLAVQFTAGTFYAKHGHYFARVNASTSEPDDNGVVDLLVEVVDEGPRATLGDIHVVGCRKNSKEDVLKLLQLREGMELRGNFEKQITSKLQESGRYLGYRVVSQRAGINSTDINVLIILEENWEAPGLNEPLSEEQEVMLKFAKWFNKQAGKEDPITFSLHNQQGESQPFKLTIGDGGVAIHLEASELLARLHGEWGKHLEFISRTGKGGAFRAKFPLPSNKVTLMGFTYTAVPRKPFGKTGGFGVQAFAKQFGKEPVALGTDPSFALHLCGSSYAMLTEMQDDKMVLRNDQVRLELDRESGRLISFEWNSPTADPADKSKPQGIKIWIDPDGMKTARKEMEESSRGVENWAEDRGALSVVLYALVYASELLTDEEFPEAGFDKLSPQAAKRAKRWEPVLGALDEFLASLKSSAEEDEDAFFIPTDPKDLENALLGGGNLSFLLTGGYYGMIAEHLEPGTWPDLLAREILFFMGGKTETLDQTLRALLNDEDMGPFGCTLCHALLSRIKHPAAGQFAAKAEREQNVGGFAKDWKILMGQKAGEGGIGWELLKSLKDVDPELMDELIPNSNAKLRDALKKLIAQANEIGPETKADSFRNVLGALWGAGLGRLSEAALEAVKSSSQPKYNPELVAATIDGFPLSRAAVKFMEQLAGSPLEAAFPIASVSVRLKEENDIAGAAVVMLANEILKTGRGPTPQQLDVYTRRTLELLGADAQKQIEAMGFMGGGFKNWVGILVTAEAYAQGVMAKSQAPEAALRKWYEDHKDLYRSGSKQAHVHTIRLDVKGDLKEKRELAKTLHEELSKAGDMQQTVKAFAEAARKHSNDLYKDKGGEVGWVDPHQEFMKALADAIAKVPDQKLAEPVEIKIGDRTFIFLILISEPRRELGFAPYAKVQGHVKAMHSIEQEMERLSKQASVVVLNPAAGGANKGLLNRLLPMLGIDQSDDKPSAGKDAKPAKTTWRPSSVEDAIARVEAGHPEDAYYLGMMAERGLLQEKGMEVAHKHYQTAAKAGDRKAMLRLAELHRLGNGVAKSEKRSQEWKAKAAASLAASSE